jgi:hypothetical protein
MRQISTTKDLIDITSSVTQENINAVKKRLSKLTSAQMNWRPNPGVWNVNEILAHLNSYAAYYHPTFLKKIENTRFTSTKEGFMSSPLGRSAWKSMKLGNARNVKRKFKAPKGHNPTIDPELVGDNEVEKFIEHQEDLLNILDKAKEVNLKRVKIPISISKIVRLRLGDALLFVIYHNERHVQQILNLVGHPNFPKKK